MSNLLYAIAVILLIAWALGFFVYSVGSHNPYTVSDRSDSD